MNFSDETVEKVHQAISANIIRSDDKYACAKAALQSLTLADLMQVPEVRELVSQWQPIETAPKDGTRILLLNNLRVRRAQKYKQCAVCHWDGGGNGWKMTDAYEYDWFHYPTHWMPIPKPPEAK